MILGNIQDVEVGENEKLISIEIEK